MAKQRKARLKKGPIEISKEYKNAPSIENYLRLRRAHPNVEIEVAVTGGMDQLFYMEAELQKYGIDARSFAGVLDADPKIISSIALHLMEKIVEARKLSKRGETHLIRRKLVVPDKLIDWIISCSLDALSWNDDLYIPRDLIVLIRERLGGSNGEYEQGSRAHHHKMNAGMVAGQLKAQGIKPTFRLLGKIFGVAPSTVKRWFAPGEVEREAERWSRLFDEKGNSIPLSKLSTQPLRKKHNAQRLTGRS